MPASSWRSTASRWWHRRSWTRSRRGRRPRAPRKPPQLAGRNGLEAAVLYIDIRRWEPNGGSAPTFIIAAVVATLIEPATGHVLWTGEQPSRPVQTPGIVNLGDAYAVAARTLMAALLAPLFPGAPHETDAKPRSGAGRRTLSGGRAAPTVTRPVAFT